MDRGNLRRAAAPALADAAAAIILRDTLAPAERDTLAGPWEAIASAIPADD